jgi:hypothetical protein
MLPLMLLLMSSAWCAAQGMPPSHSQQSGSDPHAGMQQSQGQGSVTSSRIEFGMQCGIRDPSPQNATRYSRSADGEWSVLDADMRPGMADTGIARVWRESNWMVDLHAALGNGMASMHTGQMCFGPTGRITLMIDRYMDMAQCGCLRYTALTFGTDGRVMRREQRYVNVSTNSDIAVPEAAKDFPAIWEYRRLDQLPFYSLVKK